MADSSASEGKGPPRWRRRPPGSNWGAFGADDQAGRMNLVTPEVVRRAVGEVREGRVFCLSLPLDRPGGSTFSPGRNGPSLAPTDRNGKPFFLYPMEQEKPGATDVVNDDQVLLATHYSTHWDALCHIGYRFDPMGDGVERDVFYNGFAGGEAIRSGGVSALGIEVMAASGVQTRGVMADVHAHVGDAHVAVGYELLMRVLESDGAAVEPGDILCLHTGFGQALRDMSGKPDVARLRSSFAGLDGRDERLLRWIDDSGLVAIAADNHAVEFLPAKPAEAPRAPFFPLHEHCLFKLGVHLGEFWYLTELAAWLRAAGRARFMLTAPPLRLPGAVGAPVNPVATV